MSSPNRAPASCKRRLGGTQPGTRAAEHGHFWEASVKPNSDTARSDPAAARVRRTVAGSMATTGDRQPAPLTEPRSRSLWIMLFFGLERRCRLTDRVSAAGDPSAAAQLNVFLKSPARQLQTLVRPLVSRCHC